MNKSGKFPVGQRKKIDFLVKKGPGLDDTESRKNKRLYLPHPIRNLISTACKLD